MSGRLQDTMHFSKEGGQIRITMRGFDIYNHIKAGIVEGQLLRIGRPELKSGHAMRFPAEFDRPAGKVHSSHLLGLLIASDKRTPASTAAADFEDVFSAEINGTSNVIVQLNTEPVGFIGRF